MSSDLLRAATEILLNELRRQAWAERYRDHFGKYPNSYRITATPAIFGTRPDTVPDPTLTEHHSNLGRVRTRGHKRRAARPFAPGDAT